MSTDLRITQITTGGLDLLFENGDLALATEGIEAAQHASLRVLIFKGEMALGGSIASQANTGTQWYEKIFNMALPQVEKEFELKRRILSTPGVKEITEFQWEQVGHSVTVTMKVLTDWGEYNTSAEIVQL